jgi:hypothetical protein
VPQGHSNMRITNEKLIFDASCEIFVTQKSRTVWTGPARSSPPHTGQIAVALNRAA